MIYTSYHFRLFILCILSGMMVTCNGNSDQTSGQQLEELLLIRKNEIMKGRPEKPQVTTVWNLKKTDLLRVNLVEMTAQSSKHYHPDADHSLIILEGTVKARIDSKDYILEKGDFISIPKGMEHQYTVVTDTVLMVSMDAPYYDPDKTVRLEND